LVKLGTATRKRCGLIRSNARLRQPENIRDITFCAG
jgi:hypothetical protein